MGDRELVLHAGPSLCCPETGAQSRVSRFEFLLFQILFLLVALYKLQLLFPVLSKLHLREILYVYLYARLFISHRPPLTKILFLLSLMLGLSALVGVLTFVGYGPEMAAKGFMRFVNAMLLGPLAVVYVRDERDVKRMVNLWVFVVMLGAATAVYQFMGGDLPIFDDSYYAGKEHNEAIGMYVRFQTLLGESNVGGMAAPIVLLSLIYLVESKLWIAVAYIAAVILLVLSMSKAGIAGVMFVLFLVAAAHLKRRCCVSDFIWRKALVLLVTTVVALVAIFAVVPDAADMTRLYSEGTAARMTGSKEFESGTMSLGEDLAYRLYGIQADGLRLVMRQSDLYPINVLIGSTYGVVGSAAMEVRGDADTFHPHNSIAEVYFAGGLAMLFTFLALLFVVARKLYRLSLDDRTFTCLFIAFLLMLAILPTYPVIYEPIMGSLFWVTIGISGNAVFGANRSA